MKSLFVTSSGTDIGKTHVCCRLIEALRPRIRLRCIKPVVTGFHPGTVDSSDTARLLRAQEIEVNQSSIEATSPWRFRAALSADMAAAREGRGLPFDEVLAFCRSVADVDLNLIEGIGGVMAPIDETHTVLDWISSLETKTLLVVGSYLGSLSHTLSAVDVLARCSRTPAVIVISQSEVEPIPTEETAECLARHCAGIPISIMPRGDRHGADRCITTVERTVLQE